MKAMRDVAALAGVSETTVSRVINGSSIVSAVTRKRVERAIRSLRYKPNLVASGLRKKNSLLVGLVVPEAVHFTFATLIQHIHQDCTARGFDVLVGCHGNRPETEERFIEGLIRRHVDGIIFTRVSDESRSLRLLERSKVPMVVIDRAVANERIAHVVVDNRAAGALAARHFAEGGHRRIACITGREKIALCRERLRGFSETLDEYGIGLPAQSVFPGDFKFESGIEGARALLSGRNRASAIWAQNDLMAAGVLKFCAASGIAVPGELSVVGMDNSGLSRMITPALSTVSQPFEEMCTEAVGLLMAAIHGTETYGERRMVEPHLIVRESSAPRRSPA